MVISTSISSACKQRYKRSNEKPDKRPLVICDTSGCLLDPKVLNVTLTTMSKAARAVGRELKIAVTIQRIQPPNKITKQIQAIFSQIQASLPESHSILVCDKLIDKL